MAVLAEVGFALTGSPGTWTGTPVPTLTFQWYGAGVPIPFANSLTYVPVIADIGKTVTFVVTGTNSAGTAIAVSLATGPVMPATSPANNFSTTYATLLDA